MIEPVIQLASGRYFNFTKFGPEDIDINDIAHALSHLCRYTGHTHPFYSVAQHSVLVSSAVTREFAFEGLLHDASEAYLGDVSRPLKQLLPDYRALERDVDAAIRIRFGLPLQESQEVKEADNVLLVTEHRDLMPLVPANSSSYAYAWEWARDIPRLPQRIVPMSPIEAEHVFLRTFYHLVGTP